MIVTTDQGTFLIVFIGILAILGILGGAYLVLGLMSDNTKQKVEVLHAKRNTILDDMKEALEKSKLGIIAAINADKTAFNQTPVEEFADMIRDFLNTCIFYAEENGLDPDAAIEDAILYSRDIFGAYSHACVAPERVEEHTGLVATFVREGLRLEALDQTKRSLLNGGLSNPA